MLKCYYAHSMHLYGTLQEKRDVEFLTKLGFVVVNPSDDGHTHIVQSLKDANKDVMSYFEDLVSTCDVLAFRAFSDGKIGAGVYAEINAALSAGHSVIELPSSLLERCLTIESTRQRLMENGQR